MNVRLFDFTHGLPMVLVGIALMGVSITWLVFQVVR